jgi:glutamate synthase (NADPH/NADH) large chain
MPTDYRRVLEVKAKAEADGLTEDEANHAIMEVLHG